MEGRLRATRSSARIWHRNNLPFLEPWLSKDLKGNQLQPLKPYEPKSEPAPAELLPARRCRWQKRPFPLCLGKRVRAGESPSCESTKNATQPAKVQSSWSSADLPRRSDRR